MQYGQKHTGVRSGQKMGVSDPLDLGVNRDGVHSFSSIIASGLRGWCFVLRYKAMSEAFKVDPTNKPVLYFSNATDFFDI